jgi:hypothetical protein
MKKERLIKFSIRQVEVDHKRAQEHIDDAFNILFDEVFILVTRDVEKDKNSKLIFPYFIGNV